MSEPYSITYHAPQRTMEIVLRQTDRDTWRDLSQFVKAQLEAGTTDLLLDLTELKQLASADIGMLVGINGNVLTRGGHMRVRIVPDSPTAQLLRLTRVDTILELVME